MINSFSIIAIALLFFGIIMILFPPKFGSKTFGIRMNSTLRSEEAWMYGQMIYAVLVLTVAIILGVMGILKQILHIQSYYGMFIILLFWLGSRKLIDWMINRKFPE